MWRLREQHRTRGSNGVNDVDAARSYFGGSVDTTTRSTVRREIANLAAIRIFGTPQRPTAESRPSPPE